MIRDSDICALVAFCTLAGLPGLVAAAEPLGRLFFTPEERATLDNARSKKTRVNLETENVEAPPPPPPAPEVVTHGGVVQRSDGKATVWLNRQPLSEKDIRSGTTIVGSVRPDGSVVLQSPQSGRRVNLKVGQSAELLSGTVEETYARRGIAAKPEARPEPAAPPKTAAETGAQAAARAQEERAREERERTRVLEDATRALEEATARLRTRPAPATPGAEPAPAGASPMPAPPAPAR